MWASWSDIAATWRPTGVVHPTDGFDREGQRKQWARAVERAKGWYAELTALDF